MRRRGRLVSQSSFTVAELGSATLSHMDYGYDALGRLDSVSEPGIGAAGFSANFGYAANSDLPSTVLSKAGVRNNRTRRYW